MIPIIVCVICVYYNNRVLLVRKELMVDQAEKDQWCVCVCVCVCVYLLLLCVYIILCIVRVCVCLCVCVYLILFYCSLYVVWM